jgi:hypothetical protein
MQALACGTADGTAYRTAGLCVKASESKCRRRLVWGERGSAQACVGEPIVRRGQRTRGAAPDGVGRSSRRRRSRRGHGMTQGVVVTRDITNMVVDSGGGRADGMEPGIDR